MEMAERFKMPILTFIDTPGAYPGIVRQERGQSEAIAYNLAVMSRLKTPIISTVIGAGRFRRSEKDGRKERERKEEFQFLNSEIFYVCICQLFAEVLP